MIQTTVIDFIENYFSRRLDPDFIIDLRSRRIDFDHNDFTVAYAAWREERARPVGRDDDYERLRALRGEPSRAVPGKPIGNLRPLLLTESHPPRDKPNLGYFVFDGTEGELWRTVDALKHHLLYCHSVAVENPMAIWMSEPKGQLAISRAVNLQRGVLGWHFNARPILARWAALLMNVRPLVEAGVLVFVEMRTRDPYLLQRPKAIDYERLQEVAGELGLDQFEYLRAVESLALTVHARERSGGAIDFDLSNAASRKLVDRVVGHSGPMKAVESDALATILTAEVPAIAELSMADLVAVRQGADEFEAWRRGLESIARRAFDEVRGMDLPNTERRYELTRRFHQDLLELRKKLLADVAKTSMRDRVGKAALKFTVGATVGAIAGWKLGLAVAVADVVRDFVKTLAEAVVERDPEGSATTAAKGALRGLFVAFEGEPGGTDS